MIHRYLVRELVRTALDKICLVSLFLYVLMHCRLPLVQCKQKFSAMDMKYKENLREWISEHARKYKSAKEM